MMYMYSHVIYLRKSIALIHLSVSEIFLCPSSIKTRSLGDLSLCVNNEASESSCNEMKRIPRIYTISGVSDWRLLSRSFENVFVSTLQDIIELELHIPE